MAKFTRRLAVLRARLYGPGLCLALLVAASCAENEFQGTMIRNRPPETWITSGPLEGSTTGSEIKIYWGGHDSDGEIARFEYVMTNNGSGGMSPQDTAGSDKWTRVSFHEQRFHVSADQPDPSRPNSNKFQRSHTFFVRAVDKQGLADPTPAYRSFTATTQAPEVRILGPVNPRPADIQPIPPHILFRWEATDENPDDPADSTRYVLFHPAENTEQSLLALQDTLHLLEDHSEWTPWRAYNYDLDSTRTAVIQDLAYPPAHYYLFVVQAKDLEGAVTPTFDVKKNVRRFHTKSPTGPVLFVKEATIGVIRFLSNTRTPYVMNLPAGQPLEFSWWASPASVAEPVLDFRYGWDIVDPGDSEFWPVKPDPSNTSAPRISWSFGQHLLRIEARDVAGGLTVAQFQVNIVPFTMERPLLWVDDARDARLPTNQQKLALAYDDAEHDAEWLKVLARVKGFSPDVDVYDTSEHAFMAPPLELLALYQNIVWNTGGAETLRDPLDESERDALVPVIRYLPPCVDFGVDNRRIRINSLSTFLRAGGHLWLSGQWSVSMATPIRAADEGRFPSIMRTEYAQRCADKGEVDTSGVHSFPYADVGLVAVDRSTGASAQFKTGVDARNAEEDGLYEAPAINPAYPEFELIDVGGGSTIPAGIPSFTPKALFVGPGGGYYEPVRRGFDFTDIFNPQYWLNKPGTGEPLGREEFIPLWSHNTRATSILSIFEEINGGWSTVHAWREADLGRGLRGVMAKSLYMGFEPYYFEFEQFQRLANYVFFVEWQLEFE